jgi:hypothetical protein
MVDLCGPFTGKKLFSEISRNYGVFSAKSFSLALNSAHIRIEMFYVGITITSPVQNDVFMTSLASESEYSLSLDKSPHSTVVGNGSKRW